MKHTPVLLQKVIAGLNIHPGGQYIDATFGEGGYTQAILDSGGSVLALDCDPQQIELASKKLKTNHRLKLVVGNFADIVSIATVNHHPQVDGIVFDLGLSMRQLFESKRGLSYQQTGERLDMRLDPTKGDSAEQLINRLTREELYQLFMKNAEEVNARVIAQTIIQERQKRKISTSADLVASIEIGLGRYDEKVIARIFQAVRIAVNNEFDNLRQGIKGAYSLLRDKGRIVIVTFHSLEDRIVKRLIKEQSWRQINLKKAFRHERLRRFERSAKMRVIEKI